MWVEKLGLADNAQLQQMVGLSKMYPGHAGAQMTDMSIILGYQGTLAGPPGLTPVEWVPMADVAKALGVDQTALGEVVHRANPRLAQLRDGAQQLQIDATKVWRLAESLGVKVPKRFAPKRVRAGTDIITQWETFATVQPSAPRSATRPATSSGAMAWSSTAATGRRDRPFSASGTTANR